MIHSFSEPESRLNDLREGDIRALRFFFDLYARHQIRFAFKITQDEAEAEQEEAEEERRNERERSCKA